MVEQAQVTGEQVQVEISELNKVKGFGQSTIDKLRSKWIKTIKELKDKMDGSTARDFQDTLTPIQFKQAQNYFIENPYDYV